MQIAQPSIYVFKSSFDLDGNLNNSEVKCEYKTWVFPGGELGFKFDAETVEKLKYLRDEKPGKHELVVSFDQQIVTSESIQMLYHVTDALENIFSEKPAYFTLDMTYLPFARQDRVCHAGESFALKVFLKQMYPLGVNVIHASDIHNYAAVETILKDLNRGLLPVSRLKVVDTHQKYCATAITPMDDFDHIVAPDKGAMEKAKEFRANLPHTFLNKTRVDGKVVYEDLTPGTLSGKVLVLDDIFDHGTTFGALAEMLRRTQPDITELSLYVTHGIFSGDETKMLKNLSGYKKVFCFNVLNPKAKELIGDKLETF
jgi:phosphoribosylpyrophosphate synthetase